MFRRCVECEVTVMPRPFMVCDDCAKVNDRMNKRIQWVSSGNASSKPKTPTNGKK
jgi:hypothetical protein